MRDKAEVKKENSDFVNSTGDGSYNFDNFYLDGQQITVKLINIYFKTINNSKIHR